MTDSEKTCWRTNCIVCERFVYTCELGECDQPGHEGGSEIHGRGWVCSSRCWEAATSNA